MGIWSFWKLVPLMRCSACTTDNPAGARFCHQCGAALQSLCSACGTELIPNARFCSHCGAALQADATPSAAPTNSESLSFQAEGERRHLTVLFCDLVGSTALASSMDPEDWRTAVASYHRKAAEVITRFGGHVAKYLGDGVMAFFGWPEAHDNDAERAVRAGLAMLEPLTQLNGGAAHPKLAARIGIDSGTVVVGTGATAAADVFGDTPNIAARVQSAAEPDSVLISSNTHDLISGLFVVEDRGAQALKGLAEPLRLYRVIRPSGVRGRLEAAAASRGLTPFVGREDELRLLMSRWERAREGEGQVALIIGEAGIGKSRLVHRFHEAITGTPHTWIEAGAGAFFQNTPFYPITEMLRQLGWEERLNQLDNYLRELQTNPRQAGANTGDHTGNQTDDQFARLEPRLVAAGLKPAEAMPLIAPLLNLPLPPNFSRRHCRPISSAAACSRPWSNGYSARPARSR